MTPTLTRPTTLELSDAAGRDLGAVAVESVEGELVLGTFSPGPDYGAVEPVFRELAEMVESFSLHRVDEAFAAIAGLGVTVRLDGVGPAVAAGDVQIDSDGGFACLLPATAERNGVGAH